MFVMFTIGPFLKQFEETSFVESVSQTTNVNTFNSYFGDITYYQVLENGKIPNKFYNYYVEQGSEVPYHGPVFLGLNGDFYKTEPFSIETLRFSDSSIIFNRNLMILIGNSMIFMTISMIFTRISMIFTGFHRFSFAFQWF